MTRRVVKQAYDSSGTLTETRHYYFSDQWQVVREMVSGSTAALYIWGLRYIDELLVRYDPTFGRKYAMQDANFNCTAICDDATGAGTVDERYQYDPYAGNRVILDSSWNVISTSAYNWTVGHQGLMFEAEVGIYNCRNRVYLPILGTWMQRDPIGYADGGNLYEYERSLPNSRQDESGLDSCKRPCAACANSLIGLGISAISVAGCLDPFTLPGCLAALTGLGSSIYGSVDSCEACVTCCQGKEGEGNKKPDPGSPPTPGEQCVGKAKSGSECGRCCSNNYNRDINACTSDPNNDATKCSTWNFWLNWHCVDKRNQNLSDCINDAGRAYNACWKTCNNRFPPEDPIRYFPPLNPKSIGLPDPTRPLCTS